MSTIDPDARDHGGVGVLRPVGRVLTIAAPIFPPVFALVAGPLGVGRDAGATCFVIWIVLAIVGGILALGPGGHRSGLLIAAYMLSCTGGLELLGGPGGAIGWSIWTAVNLAAVLLLMEHVRRSAAQRETRAHGVTTDGVIQRVAEVGLVNYRLHYRLTVRFVDQQGTTRYVRVGRTGGDWATDQTIPVRYDPRRPGSTRAIIVG